MNINKIKSLFVLLMLLIFFRGCYFSDPCGRGLLIVENQSDYNIAVTFHKRFNADIIKGIRTRIEGGSLQDSLYLVKGSKLEKVVYSGLDPSPHIVEILSPADSVVITYGRKKVRIHAAVLSLEKDTIYSIDSNLQELISNKRYIFSEDSYIISDKQPSKNLLGQWKGCNERTYRYIFTNADYEAAKPINP